VTARDPVDTLAEGLRQLAGGWDEAGVRSVRAVGDAWCPGTIAAAVWDGRRYAEELDQPDPLMRREIAALAER